MPPPFRTVTRNDCVLIFALEKKIDSIIEGSLVRYIQCFFFANIGVAHDLKSQMVL